MSKNVIGSTALSIAHRSQTLDEEILFLACDRKERNRLLQIEVSGIKNIAPQIKIKIDIPEHSYKREFNLICTAFGYQFMDDITNEICAHSYLSKNMILQTETLDIEYLRGMAALAFINLERFVGLYTEIATLIYSPAFTEYLYVCLDYLSQERQMRTNK